MSNRICRYLDEPPKLFFWEIDELTIMVLFIVFGIMSNAMISIGAIGVVIATVFGHFKQRQADGYLFHLLYYYGGATIKHTPPGCIYEFLE